MVDSHVRVAAAGIAGAVLAATAIVFADLAGVSWRDWIDTYAITNIVFGIGFTLPGSIIGWYRPGHRVGTLFMISGLGHLVTAASGMLLTYGLEHGWPLPMERTLVTFYFAGWQLGIGFLANIALLLFPDERLPSRRWLPVLWLTIAAGLYVTVSSVLSTGTFFGHPGVTSILDIGLVQPNLADTISSLLFIPLNLAWIAALVVRYRSGDERTKRQLLWLILALIAMLLLNTQRWITGDGPILLLLSFVLIPLAVGVAIVRHQLFDIRLVLSRTLLYGLTITVIVAAYAGLVAAFSTLVPPTAERGVQAGAAIAVAIGFTPVRLLMQRLTDRAFYGGRSNPARTAQQVGQTFNHDSDLAEVLDRTRIALRIPWLALYASDDAVLSQAGTPQDGGTTDMELRYRGDHVGTIRVELRRGESSLHSADRDTLNLIGTPLAVALHALQLTEQVRQARAATVEAAGAERVRLQRELHDGLGPSLTGLAFRADAASRLLRSDVEAVGQLIGELRTDLRAVIDDVRHIVHGLRPMELDQLGLDGALREHVAAIPRQAEREVAVEIKAPHPMPALSPAVELAAYRIAKEALTNVLRHSSARNCRITLRIDDNLHVDVSDDGSEPATWRPGVGLRSIAERAEELGGTATAGPATGGWRVTACIPIHDSGA
ncbi:sensor histidine kinase [Microbispora sp. NPDC049125]|uniref:sensor histidine kinase n=1 Tax=Microbispora sp. NPDC049125 TaxID=3154929 RepID=UPI0034652151